MPLIFPSHLPPLQPLRGVMPCPDDAAPVCGAITRDSAIIPALANIPFWSRYACPADDQGQEPSCVGRAWAGWAEIMLRAYVSPSAIPAGCQIDARKIWVRGREMFWGGDLNGGLYLHQGLAAAVDLGIFPPGTQPVKVEASIEAIGAALTQSPLVQAHIVSAGWYKPLAENGYIPLNDPPDIGRYGAHCTLLLERAWQRNSCFCLLENSWGRGWGWNGLGLMAFERWAESLCPNSLYSAQAPLLQMWRGWEKFVVQG